VFQPLSRYVMYYISLIEAALLYGAMTLGRSSLSSDGVQIARSPKPVSEEQPSTHSKKSPNQNNSLSHYLADVV